MSPVRLLIVLIAAVSAIGLAVVLQRAMGGKPTESVAAAAPAPPEPSKPMTQVLVAKRDLPIGTRLVAADVDWQAWPSDAINGAFITNGAAPTKPEGKVEEAKAAVAGAADQMIGGDPAKVVEGAIVRDPILTGEPITSRKIVRGGEGGYLSVVLTPGKRAMSVPVTSDTAVGGFILPGDRVDVLLTRETSVNNSNGGGESKVVVAETVLQNIRVLALDQSTAADKDAKSIVAATATLEVGPVEGEALARAKAAGSVTLALRAYTDLGGPSGLASSAAKDTTIRINRGGATTDVAVRP
ncbi:Flp pilus assembly protein CpaB [Caulobacter sp. RHG1]|uniref:Flp pilus assembly protein CpaB n=1 Tax=Caulobacter sp. (strain RHG1) TaxID=2545762 RepID=UPI001552BC29|nr:Flp pilus assembly protein CpaB [Caulobacter sp. RHG1]NQE64004.1 Flp pilus assembly protein RcpC/CpaB [Caulobacter sp. RHG1]